MAGTHKSGAHRSASARAQAKSKSGRTRRTGKRDPLAVRLLKTDHREVEKMFDQYEQLEAQQDKLQLFQQIALALKVHTEIEEEIFYPESRGEVEDDMLDEAQVEHDGAKKLIAEIEAMQPDEELYDAKVHVLGEYIRHHVKEEEQPGGIFAQAKRGGEDLEEMGRRL
ncbi:MAG TPA: hemerythrin domain-containing protein, partial [Caulobacteraceae bacterium]|nr:hemerythrin domain-containing protein [Caulobacteraceae bacterium]